MKKEKRLFGLTSGFTGMFLVVGMMALGYFSVAPKAQADPAVGVGYVHHDAIDAAGEEVYKNSNILISHTFATKEMNIIKAANPNILALAYVLFIEHGHSNTAFWDVYNSHEDWFLHFDDGKPASPENRMTVGDSEEADGFKPQDWVFYPNFTNADAQKFYAQTLIKRLEDVNSSDKNPVWDGIFLDVLLTMRNGEPAKNAGRPFLEYKGESGGADFNRDQLAWVKSIHDAFQQYNKTHSHKLYVYVNKTEVGRSVTVDEAKKYVDATDGTLWEDYIGVYDWHKPTRYLPETLWEDQLEVAKYIASQGKGLFAISHYKGDGTKDEARHDAIYAKASLLLATTGLGTTAKGNNFVLAPHTGYAEPKNITMTQELKDVLQVDIGLPLGASYHAKNPDQTDNPHVWERDFAGGKVLVNPSKTDQGIVQLGGSYRDFGSGSIVTSVDMTANTGYILIAHADVSANLLQNGDFSRPLGATNWTFYGKHNVQSEARIETQDGKPALHIIDVDDAGEVGVTQIVPATAGETYQAEVQLRPARPDSAAGAYVQLHFLPSDKLEQVGLETAQPISPDSTWRKVTVRATAPEGTERVQIYIYTHTAPQPDFLVQSASLHSDSTSEAK